MALRAYWKGNLKVSLVSFGVRLHNVVTRAERVTLNRIHRGCNARLKYPATCPIHGQLERDEVGQAYEFEKDKYVIVENEELEQIKLRTAKTIEVDRFVPAGSVQDVYLDSPYYVAPDGAIAEEPFRVLNQALRDTKTVGIGRVALAGKERPVLLRGEGPGFVLTTLHAAGEVRAAEPHFEDVGEGRVPPEQLRLAETLIKSMMGKFEPEEFRDRYQDALLELVRAKIEGEEPVVVQEEEIPTTFNFMEALRQSLKEQGATPGREAKPAARSKGKKAPAKKAPARGAGGAPRKKAKRAS